MIEAEVSLEDIKGLSILGGFNFATETQGTITPK
jgi:hypothetical protein